MYTTNVSAQEVRDLRVESGLGFKECQRALQKTGLRKAIHEGDMTEDVRNILLDLAELTLGY